MKTTPSTQLLLNITPQEKLTFANYLTSKNSQAVAAIHTLIQNPQDPFIFIWGISSTGCSHLTQAACHLADSLQISTAFLPLEELHQENPILIEHWEQFDFVIIDDIQLIAENKPWEMAIFNLYNSLTQLNKRLLISSKKPPRQLPMSLPDLTSRLTSSICFQLLPLEDIEKKQALIERAKHRGITLSNKVVEFILSHTDRDIKNLIQLLDTLDQTSLIEKRKLTIPLVKEILSQNNI